MSRYGHSSESDREIERIEQEKKYEQAYVIAAGKLEQDRVKTSDFIGMYKDQVEDDENYVTKRKLEFEAEATPENRKNKKLATILEAIINEQIELSDWLGPEAESMAATDYDDIKNGVDSIIEFREGEISGRHLALAIDASYSTELSKKLDRIKREIEEGLLTEVKYFYSDQLDFRGRLEKIPRVVVGAERNRLTNLIFTWLESHWMETIPLDQQKKLIKEEGLKEQLKAIKERQRVAKKQLEIHPMQFLIIAQIIDQLDAFQGYAEKIGQTEVAEKMGRRIKLMHRIQEIKSTSPEQKQLAKDAINEVRNDEVYIAIRDFLQKL